MFQVSIVRMTCPTCPVELQAYCDAAEMLLPFGDPSSKSHTQSSQLCFPTRSPLRLGLLSGSWAISTQDTAEHMAPIFLGWSLHLTHNWTGSRDNPYLLHWLPHASYASYSSCASMYMRETRSFWLTSLRSVTSSVRSPQVGFWAAACNSSLNWQHFCCKRTTSSRQKDHTSFLLSFQLCNTAVSKRSTAPLMLVSKLTNLATDSLGGSVEPSSGRYFKWR